MPKKIYVAEFYDRNGNRRRTQHPTLAAAKKQEAEAKIARAQATIAKLSKTVSG